MCWCLCLKCSKTHALASLIPKFSRGWYPRTLVKREQGRREMEGRRKGKRRASWLSGAMDSPGRRRINLLHGQLQNVNILMMMMMTMITNLTLESRRHTVDLARRWIYMSLCGLYLMQRWDAVTPCCGYTATRRLCPRTNCVASLKWRRLFRPAILFDSSESLHLQSRSVRKLVSKQVNDSLFM